MSHDVIEFNLGDGTRERVWHGSPRYLQLITAGHTPVGTIPAGDGISDRLQEYLAQAFTARRLAPQVWAIGDSNTSNGILVSPLTGERMSGVAQFGPSSHLGWALLQTSGRFVFGGVTATNGHTTTQMVATQLPLVTAAAPGVCVILAGTNDVAGNNLVTTTNNLRTMVTELRKVGTVPLLCTIPPQGVAPVTFVSKLNAWIRKFARTEGIPCADFHEVLVQATTGGMGPAYNAGDGIHLTNLGARACGDILARVLNSLPVQPPAPQFLGGFDSNAMMRDPCYQVVTSHWAQAGAGVAVTTSTGAGWKGNKVTMTAGGASHSKFVTGTLVQPALGDRVSLVVKVDAGTPPALGLWRAHLGNTGGQFLTGYTGMDQALPVGSVMAFEFTVTAAMLNANPWTLGFDATVTDGTTLSFAQASMLNLTALGAV